MRWHTLRRHLNPIASGVDVPIPRELQSPECRVDAHDGLGVSTFDVTGHRRTKSDGNQRATLFGALVHAGARFHLPRRGE